MGAVDPVTSALHIVIGEERVHVHSCLLAVGAERPQSDLSPKKTPCRRLAAVGRVFGPASFCPHAVLGVSAWLRLLWGRAGRKWKTSLDGTFTLRFLRYAVKWPQTVFMAVMKCDRRHLPGTSFVFCFFSVNHFAVFRHSSVSLQQELCRHSPVHPSRPSALQSKRQNSLPLRVKR